MVNVDFHEMFAKVKEQLPSLRIHHGGDALPKKPKARVHPMVGIIPCIYQHTSVHMAGSVHKFRKAML